MPYTLDIIPEFINPIVNNKYPRLPLKNREVRRRRASWPLKPQKNMLSDYGK